MPIEARIGKVLSARNLADLEQAISLIQTVIERAKKKQAEPEKKPEPEREAAAGPVGFGAIAREWDQVH